METRHFDGPSRNSCKIWGPILQDRCRQRQMSFFVGRERHRRHRVKKTSFHSIPPAILYFAVRNTNVSGYYSITCHCKMHLAVKRLGLTNLQSGDSVERKCQYEARTPGGLVADTPHTHQLLVKRGPLLVRLLWSVLLSRQWR